jgi:hypothetical protein
MSMDVSNSSGTKTDYRVSGTGGGIRPQVLCSGTLAPGGRASLETWSQDGCWVQFFIDGMEVACATFRKAPEAVTLHEDEWGYRVQPENGKLATAY